MSDLKETQIREMIDLCDKMLERAYAVYSNFPVAATVVTECGKVFSGNFAKDSR